MNEIKYYVLNKNENKLIECSGIEYNQFNNDFSYNTWVNQIYNGICTLENVPEEDRTKVEELFNKYIEQNGLYEDQLISGDELLKLTNISSRKEAQQFFNDIKKLTELATDDMALEVPNLYPRLCEDGSLITAGTRIFWNNEVKRAIIDIEDYKENNPDNAPELWETFTYRQGYRIIPENITSDTAFTLDECGWWKNKLYKSILNTNVYTPDEYAAGWELINI